MVKTRPDPDGSGFFMVLGRRLKTEVNTCIKSDLELLPIPIKNSQLRIENCV
jgi:hypothetical protein